MKKGLLAAVFLIFMLGTLNLLNATDMRIYNDGEIDYVPLKASFALGAEDMESTVKEIRYSINGSSIEVYDEPITFDTEGRQVIVYWAIDMIGNVSGEKIYSVIVDATPPEGFVSVMGPAFMGSDTVYLTGESTVVIWAEDELSGVDAIYVSLDNGGFVPYTEPVSIMEEGYHTASAYAVDNVGNRTEEFSIDGYVDNTPPNVTISVRNSFVEVAGKKFTNAGNIYTVSAEDEYVGIREILVSLDGSEFVTYTAPFRVQIPGAHTVQAKAVDRLGNESAPAELSFFVDITPPKASMGVSLEE